MPRKDTHHQAVRQALENDGWTITDDPLTVQAGNKEFYIDLGAERPVIGAERGGQRIAVEVKSLISKSFVFDYYQSLGQFLVYRHALAAAQPDRVLFLAVPAAAYEELMLTEIFQAVWETYSVHIVTFETQNQRIVQWIKH